jgi:hypothetical protein
LEDEERGGLESEDKSGTILDEDDFGITPPEDIPDDEESGIIPPEDISVFAEDKFSATDETGCSGPEDSGTFDSDESCDSIADEFGVSPSKSDAKADEER